MEPVGRAERGGADCENADAWIVVRGDFQELGRIGQAVDLVEDDDPLGSGGEERLWVIERRSQAWVIRACQN